jgi:radical SAM/Cys-rich protein
VDAGPDRKEIMSRETMEQCLSALRDSTIQTVDLTGGAPEMNPHFRWFVEEVSALKKHIIVRCNLTIILANKKYHDLPDFFKKHRVEVVSSLTHFTALRTDRQRGEGVFSKSIEALQKLNAVGYGIVGSGLLLNLVYNPTGAILPSDQKGLEAEFKLRLKTEFNIDFNALFSITNMPISRYLEFLMESGNLESYMEKLVDAFNPLAVQHVMCRNTISVGWEGTLYDCDFNQMLELPVNSIKANIRDFDEHALGLRSICVDDHCYGCTAGAGSSCGGEIA